MQSALKTQMDICKSISILLIQSAVTLTYIWIWIWILVTFEFYNFFNL